MSENALTQPGPSTITPAELVASVIARFRADYPDMPADIALITGLLVAVAREVVDVERFQILCAIDPAGWVYNIGDGPYAEGFKDGLRAAWNRIADRIDNGKQWEKPR